MQGEKVIRMKKFTRTKENFVCEKCGTSVNGNGYTNHCPNCLWSKHVDINPGDRRATCGGLMEPIGVKVKSHSYTIIHECINCHKRIPNKASADDNRDVIAELSARPVK
jgi:hypothetical protein